MELRIVDLEIRFMHKKSTLQELNEVVISQQKRIDQIIKEVDLLKKQIRASSLAVIRDPS